MKLVLVEGTFSIIQNKIEVVKTTSKIEVPKLPPDIAHQLLLAMLSHYIADFMQALTDKFGSKEALKFIRPYLLERGKHIAEAAPKLGITGKDAIAIGTFIRIFEEEIMKIEGKVTEASPDKVVVVNTKCILQDCKSEACLQFQSLVDGIIGGINPEVLKVMSV